MARRKKEEPIVHQNRIAKEAAILFSQKGIDNTSMDDIARNAGYSKATLYVYFQSKEEIVSYLALKSMRKLKDILVDAIAGCNQSREGFMALCGALEEYQREYPELFDRAVHYIRVEADKEDNSLLSQTYQAGEDIIKVIIEFLRTGIQRGELRSSENEFETIFQIWGMLSGLIKLANEKEEYIELAGNISKRKFLDDGYESVYRIIQGH